MRRKTSPIFQQWQTKKKIDKMIYFWRIYTITLPKSVHTSDSERLEGQGLQIPKFPIYIGKRFFAVTITGMVGRTNI